MKILNVVNKWFYVNVVHLRPFHETKHIYDFVVSSFGVGYYVNRVYSMFPLCLPVILHACHGPYIHVALLTMAP